MLNLLYRHGATQNIGDYAQSGNIAMVAELLGEHPEKVLDALGNAAYMKQPDIVEMVPNQYKPELTEEPWFQALYDAMRARCFGHGGDLRMRHQSERPRPGEPHVAAADENRADAYCR